MTGRSNSTFYDWINPINVLGDPVTLPEKDLWVAVLCQAALDACKGPPRLDFNKRENISHKNHYMYDRDQAQHFFLAGGSHFKNVCEMAGRNPDYVQQKIRKILLRKNGWNVDTPLTSRYRQGLKGRAKRGKYKKRLTGNAYYAARGQND